MNILVTIPKGPTFDSFVYQSTIDRMKKMGNVVLNETTSQFTHEQLCEKIKGIDLVVTGWGTPRIDEEVVKNADCLKYIAHTGGAVASYVCEDVYKKGIVVMSGNEMYAESVAEGCVAYILASLRMIPYFSHKLSYEKSWETPNLSDKFVKGLLGKTVGIVSYGTISKYLIPMLKPFHVKIKLYSRKPMAQEFLDEYNAEQVSLEDLFANSDIISIHTAWNKHTENMIDKKYLSLIKDGALFMNTARGQVVNEADLLEEVKKDRFYTMLDVYHQEPVTKTPDSPLFGREKVLLMPHMGGPTIDYRNAITNELLSEVERHIKGEPIRLEIPWEVAKNMTLH